MSQILQRHITSRRPFYLTTDSQHRLLAAIYARLGEREKARLHAAKVLEAEPGFKVSIFAETMPFRDPSVLQDYLGGLKQAGLPD